jgi:acyl-CoA synthetase (AMP-forming)/AMP-acid ligase II
VSEDTLGARLERAARHVDADGAPRGVRFLERGEGDGTWLSYAEIFERARRVAGGLQALELRPGDRVALVLPTAPSFFDAFFGAILAGVVPVPLYPPLRLGRLDEYHARTAAMVEACGARLVLSDRRIARLLGSAVAEAKPDLGLLTLDSLARREPAPVCVAPDDVAFVQFSSGTTRAPKPICLSHRAILANVRAILGAILAAHPESDELRHVGVSWLPLYHDMGLVGAVLVAVDRPGELVLIPPERFIARPALWLEAISRFGGTISPAPNFAYALCAERVRDSDLVGVDLSRWRVALNGAEPVTPAVLERFVARFAHFGLRGEALTPVYGLAEATLAVTFSDLHAPFRRARFDRNALLCRGIAIEAAEGHELASLGPPLPGFALRIVDENGADVTPGRVGRLLVRGPSLMDGYHDRPLDTAAVLRDGWLDTGDTGFLHGGELYLYGRAKDMIVLRGRNHAPQDIEQVAHSVSGVRAGCAAAVGIVPEGGDGEELYVFVERTREAARDDHALADAVTRAIAEATGLVPSRVVVLAPGTLPRTSSGKLRRDETRRRHLAGSLTPPRRVTLLHLVTEMVRARVRLVRSQRAR